jgi:uncharacterized GH25 family protein
MDLWQQRFSLAEANVRAEALARECVNHRRENQKVMLAGTDSGGEQEWVVLRERTWVARNQYGQVVMEGGKDDWQVCIRVMVYRDDELDAMDAAELS